MFVDLERLRLMGSEGRLPFNVLYLSFQTAHYGETADDVDTSHIATNMRLRVRTTIGFAPKATKQTKIRQKMTFTHNAILMKHLDVWY
jgi:hypothetical protein